MATTRYFVYKDLEKKAFDLDPASTMDKVRNVLTAAGWMSSYYLFTYYNDRTEKIVVLVDSDEATSRLGVLISNNEITITNVNSPKPDLTGRITNWFTNRNMQAAVVFNQEPEAQKANAGKFPPFLLSNVVSTNPDLGVNFTNAVICEKGSVIAFNISSWGAAGYGFSIKSSRTTFASSLYVVNDGKYGTIVNSGVGRYQDAQQMIQVDSNESQNIPGIDNVQYSEVRIRTWNVSSYKSNGKTYSSDLRPPQRRGAADPGGFTTNNQGVLVPGAGIETASPHAGGASQHTFGGGLSDVQEDSPDGAVPIGEVVIYFLVFKDHETAKRVIRQQSSASPY